MFAADQQACWADPAVKAKATLAARCALLGVSLQQIIEDDWGWPLFIATKSAYPRQLHSVDEVEAFVASLGGPCA